MTEVLSTINPLKYCQICGKKLAECTCHQIKDTDVKTVYSIENLDCAHCAAKIEAAIKVMPGVSTARLTFALKKLEVTAAPDNTLEQRIQAVCDQLEEGVVVTSRPAGAVKVAAKTEPQNTSFWTEERKEMAELIIGGVLFVATEWAGIVPENLRLWVLLIAYIILGREIVALALKNILKGNALDENFLMSLATIGAFAIKSYEEAVGVMLFYRVGEFFEEKAVEKSRSQIMDAVDLRPEVVNLVVENGAQETPAGEVQVGDILLVRAGDRIPLDGVVLEGESLLDTAPLTGEPVPVRKSIGDQVLSGCINTNAMLKIKVEKVLAESMVTKILNSVENAAASKPKIDKFITRFARIYTPIVVGVAVLVALGYGLVLGQWYQGIYTALTFLVISCPCALVLSVPLSFFAGIGAASKQGILFKGGIAIEALKNIKAVVMDKTGTITQGNFVVQHISPVGNATPEELLSLCASGEQMSSHPIAKSIVSKAKEINLTLSQPTAFEEFSGQGLSVTVEGHTILCGNDKLMARFNIAYLNSNGKGTEVLVAKDGMFVGSLLIGDTVKADAKEAINAMKDLGMTTAMLTGDSVATAEAVASQVGIDEVHGQMLPQDKLDVLQQLRQKVGAVMFVGDGINDAPVLAGADVGAAMGTGADAAIEAADVVFLNSKLACVPTALAIAKETTKVSWQNVYFAIGVKFVILVAGIMGYASMWAAVFADTGVAALCVLNSIRILYKKI